MFIAKVIGNVVSTQKIAKFRGMKLLLIQPYISREGKLQISGSSVVAVDSVGAGVGECVLFTQGSSARLTPTTKDAPVDAVIVGIVDTDRGGRRDGWRSRRWSRRGFNADATASFASGDCGDCKGSRRAAAHRRCSPRRRPLHRAAISRRCARWRVRHRGRSRERGLRGAEESRGDDASTIAGASSTSFAASATTAAKNWAAWSSKRPRSAGSITRF